MAAKTEIAADQLVRRILDGERDFSETRLVAVNLDEARGYSEMIAYLQEQDLRANPLNFERADWRGVRAVGLFWERTKMAGDGPERRRFPSGQPARSGPSGRQPAAGESQRGNVRGGEAGWGEL